MSFSYSFPIGLQRAPDIRTQPEAPPRTPPRPTVILPSFDRPSYRYTLKLSGQVYGIAIARNRRDGHRYLSLSRGSEPVLSGVRITDGWPLLRGADPRLPPGQIVSLGEGVLAYVEAP